MSAVLALTRRGLLCALGVTGALGPFLLTAPGCARETAPAGGEASATNPPAPAKAAAANPFPSLPPGAAGGSAIRPFRVNVPEEQLTDLRRRITATRWPDRETVADASQGVRLATAQALARYWATEYDWRKCEAKLNALPNFVTTIDGLDIHFLHVRSKHEDALPLVITHGWPGSVIEQLKVVDPLTNPTAHGGKASDAFHLVIPSMPGYGFSGKPTETGWDPVRIARAWVALMSRLGYKKYVAQGGDWGDAVTEQMALLAPPGLLGIHTNMPATVPADVAKALKDGAPPPAGLTADERRAYDQLDSFYKHGLGYALEMQNRPQTLYALADSPVGLAAWVLDHDARSEALIARVFGGQTEGLTRDDVLDNITLYWLTNTAVSSARLYWENKLAFFDVKRVTIPVAVSAFPDEIYQAPRSWAERALLLTTRAAVRHLGAGGSVINIGSVVARITPPHSAVYSGTKGAVDAITGVLARELGPKGIRVNALNPGLIETEGTHAVGFIGSDREKTTLKSTPLGRGGKVGDVASVAVFLASDDSGWLTGEHLIVSGGVR